MGCEEYSDSIIDAALGGLHAERETELFAHFAECDGCREQWKHVRALASAVDRGVQGLVAGEPSPQFARRLRARIADGPAPRRFAWAGWVPVAASAIVLAGIVAMVAMHLQRPDAPVPTQVAEKAPTRALSASAADSASNLGAVARNAHTQREHPGPSLSSRQPEVLVAPGQFAAVVRLDEALRSGSLNNLSVVARQEELEKPLAIKPLEMPPLTVPKIEDVGGAAENSDGA
jgi:anti-sigma factor RsiW